MLLLLLVLPPVGFAVSRGWQGTAASLPSGPLAASGMPPSPVAPSPVAAPGVQGEGGVGAGSSWSASSPPGPVQGGPTGLSTSPSAGLSASPSATVPPAGITVEDIVAGVRSPRVPRSGSGRLHTVRGRQAAPEGRGTVHVLRVQVEGGLAVEDARFARFVLRTLNDPRGWGAGGSPRFARTDSASADLDVILASPDLSSTLCRPLRTGGTLSCRNGRRVVLTLYRWVKATPDYDEDRTGYRNYVVNHEVGHWLGHGHEYCPGPGRLAPIMMQQTKGLKGCRPNPWPHPHAG